MYIITFILASFAIFLFILYRRRRWQTNIFKQMGIPGPEPNWLTGNQYEYDKKSGFETLCDWSTKYGKLFGYYEGPLPILVTSDPEMVKEVFVKNFSNFHGRKRFPISPHPEYGKDVNMLNVYGNRWKRLRSIINPTFSTAKLKQIRPLVKNKVDVLIDKMDEYSKKGENVNIHKDFQALTLDVIGEVAFGMEVDAQRNSKEPFLIEVKKAFEQAGAKDRPLLVDLALLFPEIQNILYNVVIYLVRKFDKWPFFWIQEQLDKVIEMRRKQNIGRRDLLQLMLDAEADADDVKNVHMWEMKADDEEEKTEQKSEMIGSGDKMSGKKKLTNLEITNQGTLFLLAGYDTTSNLLAYVAHLLAINTDKQTKLQNEIDEMLQTTTVEDLDAVQKLPYLDMVICEALRLYPVAASIVNRLCMNDCEINGVKISKGMVVQANTMAIHFDKDLWGPVDPQKFEPERFIPELKEMRHPMAWIPFGVGPRNCVGMRLALLESKLTLAKIMAQYSFVPSEKTEVPLPVYESATITPKAGVYVKIEKRF